MIKLKLKRRISGKRIRQLKRNAELRPTRIVVEEDGTQYTCKINTKWENRGIYDHNKPKKRHVENPNIYEGEVPLYCAPKNIRVPRKCRKTAWKRFHKAFPYIKVTDKNTPYFSPKLKKLTSVEVDKLLS